MSSPVADALERVCERMVETVSEAEAAEVRALWETLGRNLRAFEEAEPDDQRPWSNGRLYAQIRAALYAELRNG